MKNLVVLATVFVLFPAVNTWACDPCALYSASKIHGHREGTYTLAISEQYTSYDRAEDLSEVSTQSKEIVRGYSTTQLSVAYDLTEKTGIQLSLPLVARRFDKVGNHTTTTKSDADLGDLTLAATYSFLNYSGENWSAISGLTVGIELPTGDTGTLGDIAEEPAEAQEHTLAKGEYFKHHTVSSAGSSGRALTFGTGSYDYLLGLNFLSRYQRYLILADAQYTIRTEGDFNYEFADDFLWSVGPGYYFIVDHELTIAGQVALAGEFKGKDRLNGQDVGGSSISNIYLGPQLLLTYKEKIGLQLGIDLRTTSEDSNATIVPETRMKASLSYQF